MIEWKFYLKTMVAMVSTFFLPIAPLIALVGLAIVADTILGICASQRRKEKFSSRKFSNVVTKMLLYQGTLLFGYMMDVWLVGEFLQSIFTINLLMTKVITMTLLFAEVTSLDENFFRLTGIRLYDKMKQLLSRSKELKDMSDI